MKNQSYKSESWKLFRECIIESDGYKCAHCNRNNLEVILQVHHKKYITGRKPWEYSPSYCITLCRGCHARQHGIIMPNFGWEYLCDEDLGGLNGECDKCGNQMRFAFHIHHENWGFMQVGRQCCDNLTDSNLASNKIDSVKRFEIRKRNFLKSSRWKSFLSENRIFKNLFEIKIEEIDNVYFLTIHGKKSREKYISLDSAKCKAFEVIENSSFINYCLNKKIPLPK
ncbi:hypothetical protein Q73A0000_11055 [Kaistella flava (ex Peng et al. 2021)]|uniref:HNH endonuclease n=1 Tax=Kaistella flava (ex Peng et al. 2021) TaxID=2038776 RepID=A0A7M2YB37_9FLAO|nr:hypothetical protein [Kaistella flava (ex Peng et al. 2021)]QOW10855.1 hypothetical protein Q73A0000_11055 [Kaistella flava (ex Peng et al. 2021)]